MRYLNKIAVIFFLLFVFQIALPNHLFARRIREFSFEFFSQVSQLNYLDKNLLDFVLGLPGITGVKSISKPQLFKGDAPVEVRESSGVYKFDILTDNGIVSLAVKSIRKSSAFDFETASLIGVSPGPVRFIPDEPGTSNMYGDGYLVYPFFEGIKLSKICSRENANQAIKDNLWIIEELGIKIARLKKAGINYRDFLYYNTIVNFNARTLAIIDYGDMHCADPFVQIKSWWLPGLFSNEPEFMRKAIDIFERAYQREIGDLSP